jgi:PKD repeat protein
MINPTKKQNALRFRKMAAPLLLLLATMIVGVPGGYAAPLADFSIAGAAEGTAPFTVQFIDESMPF